jgi:CxxC-x17-CxxC domain-containing protein
MADDQANPADESAAPSGEGDQTLTCEECGGPFTFTAGEQEFFAEKGFTPPKRCPSCRQAKKERGREMTEVTCAECGQTTTVPFVPRGDTPVYCRECFEAKKNQ